ncbi:MAG: M1 family aminopeptidase [Planctomycetota bacterium]|nr:M1 family aminopeptidase [Planctomycetota bacterium]
MSIGRKALATTVVGLSLASVKASEEGGQAWSEQWSELGCMHCKLMLLSGREEELALRIESGTGRDLRNYAPDRPADIKHMKLELDIPDMNRPTLAAKQTLTLSPIARPLGVLSLNAEQLQIESVSIPDSSPLARDRRVTYSHDGGTLAVRFDPPLPEGTDADVVVTYTLDDPPDGLTWTPESPEWPGRPAQIHTQGQPETNRFWFPAHDFPNERMSTEIVATVPEGFIVSANGREVEPPATGGGKTRFHWLQEKPHVAYLVSMVVGKFDVVDVAAPGSSVPMPVYVPPGKAGLVEKTYGRTGDMLRVFEERFSEPYPWDRYAQLVVWNFGAGGMENTSATTMYDTAILEDKAFEDGDIEGLISHELAHQWFGDLITCNTWAHIWLNEGWATYSTNLWFEARDGYQNGYMASMWRTMRGLARNDQIAADAKGSALDRPGMVSPVYEHPWETFRRVSNPYPKGASVLHMLRRELGDELFFRCVADYVDRFKLKTAETADFRRTLEEGSGRSLERFFAQWCDRPGTPKVRVKGSWNARSKELRLVVEQKQYIDADHPAFAFTLPIEVYTANESEPTVICIAVDGSRHERAVQLADEPAMVLVDPDLFVLMDPELEMPMSWLVAQSRTARSIASRLDAVTALKKHPGTRGVAALSEVLRDEKEWHAVRAEAATSLGALNAEDALLEALASGLGDARVRTSAVTALGTIGGERSVAALAARAADANESYGCRRAALAALGATIRLNADEYLPIFEAALRTESQHDQVRIGALRGLEALRHERSMELCAPYVRFGTPGRTRPEAIDAVAKLSKQDEASRKRALEIIRPVLFDREERAQRAAIAALVEIGERDALADLRRLATSTRSLQTRESAERAEERLRARLDRSDSVDAAQAEIERLRGDLRRLEQSTRERSEESKGN